MAISEQVKELIAKQLEIDLSQVTDDASFTEDLGADSLDTVELVMAFEEKFDLEIPDNEAEKIKPVSILTSHGVFVDYNPPISLACFKGINTVNWSSGFSDCCHYFITSSGSGKPGLRGITEREWEKRR